MGIDFFDGKSLTEIAGVIEIIEWKRERAMAKTNYFVIVYRILSYLQTCFETGADPDLDEFGAEALHIGGAYWANILESMADEGYIKGVKFLYAGRSMVPAVDYIKITQKGMEHLEENSMMAKAKRALNEIKETVPGL